MLTIPTLDKLKALKLNEMASALEEQMGSQDCESLSFEDRLGLLVDRELTSRENRRLQTRLKQAKLRHSPPAWRTSITSTPGDWISP